MGVKYGEYLIHFLQDSEMEIYLLIEFIVT